MRVRLVAAMALAAWVSACSTERIAPAPQASTRDALLPVAMPAMAGAEPAFQERVRAQFASLTASIDRQASDTPISDAFGEVGKLLVASEFYVEAEPFLQNAQSLAPSDARWPYYLGHALRLRNQRDRAIERFERVLILQPDDVPALVWLGALHLDRGEADAADPLFSRAVALQPRSAAALSGLGRARFAQGDLASARQHLEAALTADPSAATVRYALAMTYRRLGETSRAEAELLKWKSGSGSPADTLRDGQIAPDDRLMDEIGNLLDTAIAYEIRGTRALDAQNWTEAIALFRKGLEMAPRDPALHQNLGSALYLAGDQRTAEAEFTEALRLAPGYARAHFSLGVISEEQGKDQEAIARFSDAVKHYPDLVDARFKLADALRRTGRVSDALAHYRQIFESDSSASQARFGYAMGLVRLGRYMEARAELESSTRLFAEQPGFAHALARVLAAAPDDTVRDGKRALAMVDALEGRYGATPALIETRAMALAELGRFTEAAARQRDAAAAVQRQGRPDVAARMRGNEDLYTRGMPCRIPWADDDPVHRPISGGVESGRLVTR